MEAASLDTHLKFCERKDAPREGYPAAQGASFFYLHRIEEDASMTQDTELFKSELLAEFPSDHSAPPLCLVHYFGATGQGPPSPSVGRIAERDGNLLILEFAPPPNAVKAKRQRKSLLAKAFDSLLLLLLLVSVIACIAAFRF